MKLEPFKLKVVETNGMRLYVTPEGEAYPSITTVLGGTQEPEKVESLKRWQDSMGTSTARAYTQKAANKGTNVHKLIERHLLGEDLQLKEFSLEDQKVFTALKLKLRNIEVWGLELALYSDELGVAGRTDCIGTYNGIPSIIDFKTSNRNKSEKDILDYKHQCCFYGKACNERYGTNIKQGVILMSTGTGFPLQFIFDLDEHLPALQKRIEEYYVKLAGQTFS